MLSGAEQVLLALLLAGSLALFAFTFTRKIRLVTAGAPDRPRTDQVGRRLGWTLREVLLQARVLEGRPVVGAMHTAVFLGFVLFAVETVDTFARGFGLPLLEPLLGPFHPTYQAAMAVVATVVAVAMLGLAFRRFVLVKTSPDPRSWTSGLVALFIVVLMLTYLDGIREVPIAPRAGWWIHVLVILAFPYLILKSKHFHILLSPVDIFLRTERLGQVVTLPLERMMEDPDAEARFGLEAMKDLPWKMRLDALTCVECRRCTDSCPAARAGSSLDPRGFVLAGRRALAEARADDAVIGRVITEEALGACVACGACEAACPVGVEHLQVLVGAKRAQALASGVGLVAGEFFRTVESAGNPFGVPRSERQELVQRLRLPRFDNGDSWLLWLGCVWGYNPDQRKAVAAFQQLLEAAGVPFGVLDEEPCCGHHSRRQGQEAQYQELARSALEVLGEKGVRRIVTPCPHCLHTIKREHGDLADRAPMEVVHHSELLARLVAERRLPLRNGDGERRTATYHDPCYLARFEGITDAPRALIAATGTELREMEYHGRRAFCCGGGAAGFVRETKEARVDVKRRADAAATGVPLLVTACPECRMMLDAAVAETRDVAELLASSLPSVAIESPVGEEQPCTP